MIRKANDHGAIIISLDLPTGLNASTGEVMVPCINADYTMTLAYPKIGLKENPKVVGKLFIADIGLPLKLYKDSGLEKPSFFTH
jgi:NAD(P)H-hydrate epimerase